MRRTSSSFSAFAGSTTTAYFLWTAAVKVGCADQVGKAEGLIGSRGAVRPKAASRRAPGNERPRCGGTVAEARERRRSCRRVSTRRTRASSAR